MEVLTSKERGVLALVKLNELWEKKEIKKSWEIRNLRITFWWRSKSNFWGRFGGGWNWCLGFEIGGRTVLLNLLIFSLIFSWMKEGPHGSPSEAQTKEG